MLDYITFLKKEGRALSEINPGSKEYALTIEKSFVALDLLSRNKIPILGGDVLSIDSDGKLVYVSHLFGDKYHYLNWYCERVEYESDENYIKRSHSLAKDSILKAETITELFNKPCLITLVV